MSNLDPWMVFLIGLFIGTIIGFFAAGLMATAGRGNEE